MIISITGKKQSGKDTVAKMLQFCILQKKYQNIWKNLTFEFFVTGEHTWCSGFEIKRFAQKVKKMCSILANCDESMFEKEDFKNTLLPIHLQQKNNYNRTYRWLLKEVAESLKKSIGENIWIDSLFFEYVGLSTTEKNAKIEYPNWIISDLRFLNELKYIKYRDGIVIKVLGGKSNIEETDSSETEIIKIVPDFIIENYGSIEDLYLKVREFVENIDLN